MGMLLDGDVLYGVTNRGDNIGNIRFMISAARLAPGWRSAAIVAELADPDWDCPTTIAEVHGQLLIVCSQVRAMHAKTRHACPSRSPPPISRTGHDTTRSTRGMSTRTIRHAAVSALRCPPWAATVGG